MIDIKDLNFKYGEKVIFENLNLSIKENKITTIIGPNSSGKTTLVKIILGLLKYDGLIKINDELLENSSKNIGNVSNNNQFVFETVLDEISFPLQNLNYNKKSIKKNVEAVSKKLGINDLLKCSIKSLNDNQKQLVALASVLVYEPKILILDDALNLDPLVKETVLELLKKLKKQMTIIIITNDIEDTLISDEIIVLGKGNVLQGNKQDIYNEEKTLNDLGFKLPFMVELSNRLMFYDLIDHVIYDMKEMVDELWP